jgi:UDP-4-amino-4,6-dideoxy-N-acetyl-beta-L-altrosamine transaminase
MIPYGRQVISQTDIDAVVDVLRSDWLTQGPLVPRFERAVADYCDASHAVAVNSATSALHIACLALELGPGDWLWTSPNTFVASANCALYCGARIDFVDIDPKTYNMSVQALESKLEAAAKRGALPKIVIPVHFSGQPCEMRVIHALGQRYGFKIIEDASHAIGASYRHGTSSRELEHDVNEIKVGSCTHSDLTVFSFHPVKIITTGEGGMVLTNSAELTEKMARLRTHGITQQPESMCPRPHDEIWNYQQIDVGYNYRMTDLQAALGLSQLQRLPDFLKRRRELARRYDAAFSSLPVVTPWQHSLACSSYHLYPIRVRESLCGKTQRQVYKAMQGAGIAVNMHYIPVYRQPYYETLGFKAGYCPEAEWYHKEAISLPIYPGLSDKQQEKIINNISEALKP